MRKKRAEKRRIIPDPKYRDVVVSQLVNNIMIQGKKNTARKIVYDAFDLIAQRSKAEPIDIFKKAMSNVAPVLEVRSRRVGGATYQVPVEVKAARSSTLGLRWLVDYSRKRREKSMAERLTNELIDASNGLGAAVKRREDTHKMAEANKAFAHYRW